MLYPQSVIWVLVGSYGAWGLGLGFMPWYIRFTLIRLNVKVVMLTISLIQCLIRIIFLIFTLERTHYVMLL